MGSKNKKASILIPSKHPKDGTQIPKKNLVSNNILLCKSNWAAWVNNSIVQKLINLNQPYFRQKQTNMCMIAWLQLLT
jgi:hypothetical protein